MKLDAAIFHWINTAWSTELLDRLAPWLREAEHWIPLYVAITIYLIWRFGKRAIPAMMALVLCFALTDVISSRVVKPLVERPRPCHTMPATEINLRAHCGSGYSFTSSHATNHFGFAVLSALLLGVSMRRRYLLWAVSILWASSISLAQVYVGVHYPLDIAAGAILGLGIALLVHYIYITFTPSSWLLVPRLSA